MKPKNRIAALIGATPKKNASKPKTARRPLEAFTVMLNPESAAVLRKLCERKGVSPVALLSAFVNESPHRGLVKDLRQDRQLLADCAGDGRVFAALHPELFQRSAPGLAEQICAVEHEAKIHWEDGSATEQQYKRLMAAAATLRQTAVVLAQIKRS